MLKYEPPFLVLLAALKRLVVLPANNLVALLAGDVADDVAACGHVAFCGVRGGYVDDVGEEVGFAVLAAEVLEMRVLLDRWKIGGGREGRGGYEGDLRGR